MIACKSAPGTSKTTTSLIVSCIACQYGFGQHAKNLTPYNKIQTLMASLLAPFHVFLPLSNITAAANNQPLFDE
jgi:hypothetical protein